MFLNLLFKALKGDINLRRMAAFAKRLTQVIDLFLRISQFFHIMNFSLAVSLDYRLVWCTKILIFASYLTITYPNPPKFQVALQQPPNFACGCLLVLSEVLKARPSLW